MLGVVSSSRSAFPGNSDGTLKHLENPRTGGKFSSFPLCQHSQGGSAVIQKVSGPKNPQRHEESEIPIEVENVVSPIVWGSDIPERSKQAEPETTSEKLEDWKRPQPEGVILQYVDDILIAVRTRDDCIQFTATLLNFSRLSGYRVFKDKTQIAKEAVVYLGLEIFCGHRQLSKNGKKPSVDSQSDTVREMQAFLGITGWCHLWIANYGLLVKPLYEALKAAKKGIIIWTENTRAPFKQLKHSLMSAPALELPDLTKPFELFTHERLNVAFGVVLSTLMEPSGRREDL
ncbi:hypothetical protein TURU_105575 [Turdus rufiventris]|nr:hypothetical protein TURU_105575 [Turdus rufiventris]